MCEHKGKNKATATIFFVGVMFGAIAFGSLSDRSDTFVLEIQLLLLSVLNRPVSPQVWSKDYATGVVRVWDDLCHCQCFFNHLHDVCSAEILHWVFHHWHCHCHHSSE